MPPTARQSALVVSSKLAILLRFHHSSNSNMLNRKELELNRRLFQAYAAINFLPIQFDSRTGSATPSKSWRLLAWKFNFVLQSLFTIFVDVRLVEVLLVPKYFNAVHFSIHFIVATFMTSAVYVNSKLWVTSSAAMIYNEIDKHLREGMNVN